LPGKKEYQYDDRANILEMIVRGEDGSLLSREKYDYEFDEFGNWKKMTSFVALYENGNIGYEPIEITYRTITYYYGQVAAKVATVPAGPSVSNMILAPIAVTRAQKAHTREPAIASVVMPKVATSEEKKGGKSEVPQLPVNVSSKERVYTPALGSAERQAIIGALRASVARELRKPMIFRVGDFKVKNGWAELSVTPLQHNLQPFDYQGTPYEKCMAAGNCKNYVTAVLRKQGVVWTVVKYVIGSKDVPAKTDARPPNAEKPGTKEPQ
jgi:hypothetical protein